MERILIKVGSAVIIDRHLRLNMHRITRLAKTVRHLREKGHAVALVVSGAMVYGLPDGHLSSKADKMVAAGRGQIKLFKAFDHAYSFEDMELVLMLLTCVEGRVHGARQVSYVLQQYLDMGLVPFINDNDVVDLLSFGDNDALAVRVAELMRATCVIFLSTPNVSPYGVGGAVSKQAAIAALEKRGTRCHILDGRKANAIVRTGL